MFFLSFLADILPELHRPRAQRITAGPDPPSSVMEVEEIEDDHTTRAVADGSPVENASDHPEEGDIVAGVVIEHEGPTMVELEDDEQSSGSSFASPTGLSHL